MQKIHHYVLITTLKKKKNCCSPPNSVQQRKQLQREISISIDPVMFQGNLSIAVVVPKWLRLRAQTSQDLKQRLQRLGTISLKLSSRVQRVVPLDIKESRQDHTVLIFKFSVCSWHHIKVGECMCTHATQMCAVFCAILEEE